MVEVIANKYKGSAGMTSLAMDVFPDGTANIVMSMMYITVLNAQAVPYVLNQDTLIMEFDAAKLQLALDDMMKIPMVVSTYGTVAPEGVIAKYQAGGRSGDGTPSIWVTVNSTAGTKILSVTGEMC